MIKLNKQVEKSEMDMKNAVALRNESGRRESVYKEWTCFQDGVRIGRIGWEAEYRQYGKPYEACVLGNDGVFRYIGRYSTLYAAKIGLMRHLDSRQKDERHDDDGQAPVAYLPAADFEFYPTPSAIAGELFSGVNWKTVKSILEPSAGKGDLIRYMMNVKVCKSYQGWWSRVKDNEPDVDCIELDENLRHILTGKGYRVVHDDFLTFSTRKRYDLIVMNPPFSEGDLHLLRALELCESGGQVACILNAETIRNPYTKTRQVLMKKLHEYNARIRFVEDAFAKAERRADVEVALVNVEIPMEHFDTSIIDGLKKAAGWEDDAEVIETEIAPAGSVQRLIREYDLLCAAGIELIKKYNGVAKYIMTGSGSEYDKPIIGLTVKGSEVGRRCGNADVNRFLEVARSRYWHELFNLPEIKGRMTSQMQSEYESTVSEMRFYEFSEFNVRQVLDRIMAQLNQGVEYAILKCFDTLSNKHAYHEDLQNENIHYYNGWKTNKAHYVNKRCIIPTWGCYAREWKPDKRGNYRDVYTHISPSGCFNVLDDLEKALDYLDKGETMNTNLSWALEAAAQVGKNTVVCKYFKVTFYKKGTAHIEFRDQKILDRLNIYAGRKKMWLPPTYGKVRYNDMDAESQRVVNEFMGREHYETVMQQPTEYVIEGSATPLLAGAM